MMGDCLERMKEIPDGSVDAIIADPPYQITACKWDSIIPLGGMWIELKRVVKDDGAIVMTASQPFTTTIIASNREMFKYCWVWDKKKAGNIFLAKTQPMKIHEDIVVFGKKTPQYFPIMVKRDKVKRSKNYGTGEAFGGARKKENKIYIYTHKNPVSILEASNANQKGQKHPATYPEGLIEFFIKSFTNEKQLIVDLFMGSGTTGVACKNLNRNFIGIELDETYFNIAKERIKTA